MNKPIKILHVLFSLNRGGAETFIMNLYRNIDRTKIQFDFAVHKKERGAYEDEVEKLGGKVYRIPPYNGINHIKYKKEWFDFFKTNNSYKIIHGHMNSTASIYLKIAKKLGFKTIAHSHTAELFKSGKDIIKKIMQLSVKYTADYLFACSYSAGIWLYGNKYCNKPNFYIINNAIDTEKFIFDKNIRVLKRKELTTENKFVIGHVGNFIKPKNHMFILDIFGEVYKRNPNAVLLLAGDGGLRKNIEDKIEKLSLKNNVILTGVCPNVNDLLQSMDVFLFPSLYEGLGISLIEAQANGLHCITSADTVPQLAKVTELLEYIPLDKSASYWAEQVLKYANGYERQNMQEKITKKGFDIKETAYWLEDFYLDI